MAMSGGRGDPLYFVSRLSRLLSPVPEQPYIAILLQELPVTAVNCKEMRTRSTANGVS